MPLIWGGVITLFGFTAAYLIGSVQIYQAKEIMIESKNNFNTLCNTVVLASATILALLFTVLGLSANTDISLKKAFYQRIKQVALFDTALFILTMIIFLALNFPVGESNEIPDYWYQGIYYATAVSASIIGGLIVSVIILLYNTISDLIQILGYGSKHPMADIEDDDEGDSLSDSNQ